MWSEYRPEYQIDLPCRMFINLEVSMVNKFILDHDLVHPCLVFVLEIEFILDNLGEFVIREFNLDRVEERSILPIRGYLVLIFAIRPLYEWTLALMSNNTLPKNVGRIINPRIY